jgi:hypothetical protein
LGGRWEGRSRSRTNGSSSYVISEGGGEGCRAQKQVMSTVRHLRTGGMQQPVLGDGGVKTHDKYIQHI